VLALADVADVADDEEPKQFVVAAPPGTGKTSHAIALMAATVRTADEDDPSKPYGCLFVVDQIKKADDMFLQINELLSGQVAVWP
jgi:superfamily II DNA or RNA helicase